MVQAGHDDRRVKQAEQGGEQELHMRVQAHVDDIRDKVADLPADGADNRMGNQHSRNERAYRHDHHADDFRTNLFKELF